MPLFIVVSGMFYKERNYDETIKNIFFKLILPYWIVTLVIAILKCSNIQLLGQCIINWINQICFSYSYMGRIRYGANIEGLGVLWFIPLLVGIRLIFYTLKKISKDDKIKLLSLVVCTSIIGYILGKRLFYLPFSLDVAMFSIIFYYLGYITTKTKILEKIMYNNKIMFIILLIWLINTKFNSIELAVRRYPNGILSILCTVCGIITILKFSQLIEKYIKHLGNILAWYGRNSISILIMHYAEINLVPYSTLPLSTNKKIYEIQLGSLKLLIATIGTLIINSIKRGIFYIKDHIKFNLWKKELS